MGRYIHVTRSNLKTTIIFLRRVLRWKLCHDFLSVWRFSDAIDLILIKVFFTALIK